MIPDKYKVKKAKFKSVSYSKVLLFTFVFGLLNLNDTSKDITYPLSLRIFFCVSSEQ